jgi:hypothetical protein
MGEKGMTPDKDQRLANALRENLRRRKQQQRNRNPQQGPEKGGHDSANLGTFDTDKKND